MRRLERERDRREATADMSEDFSEGEKGDLVSDVSTHGTKARLPRINWRFKKAPEGSARKTEAQKQFLEAMSHRLHVDNSVLFIGRLLFGISQGPVVQNKVRPSRKPLVDDWDNTGPLQTYATLGFRWNRWRRQQCRLDPLSRLVLGAPFTTDSVLDPLPPLPSIVV
ncbi:hypothetical protein Bca4012_083938 [Brassica carinata]